MSNKNLAIALVLSFGVLAFAGCSGESPKHKEARAINECIDLWEDRLVERGLSLFGYGHEPAGWYEEEAGEIKLHSFVKVGPAVLNWHATCGFDGNKVRWISGQTEW